MIEAPLKTSNETNASHPPPVVKRRGAVSAEASAQIPTKPNIPHVPKTPEQMARLQQALTNHIMFKHLEDDERDQLFAAMFEKSFNDGDVIIKQGDVGDNFYVVESGRCEIYVQKGSEPMRLVSTVSSGGSFGELALMYGSPRAATVIARSPVQCWALDRQAYRGILMNVTLHKRGLYEAFLERVPVLAGCTKWERLQIADALESCSFACGAEIVRQGDRGDTFYIIVEGTVKVTKMEHGHEVDCGTLKTGDYFGELALITNNPRAATVRAAGAVKCVKLDRDRFDRVLGPCEEILKRNIENYRLVMDKANQQT